MTVPNILQKSLSVAKPEDLPPLHRLLTPDEFHAAQTLSPEALATPGLFPILAPVPPATRPSLRAQADATATPQATGMAQPTIGPLSPSVQDASPGVKAAPFDPTHGHSALFNGAWAVANYGDSMVRGFLDDVIHRPLKALVNVVPESAIISGGLDVLKQSAKGDNAGAAMTALATAPFLAAPLGAEAKGYLAKVGDAWKEMHAFAPEMAQAKTIIRANLGRSAAQYEQAAFKLDEFRRILHPLPDETKFALIDAIETGKWREAAPPSPIVEQANAPITPHRLRMAEINGKMSARGGDAPSNNPYLPESPLHAEWKRGFEGVPKEDVGAENVLQEHAQGLSPEEAKQINADLAEEKQIADVQRRNGLTLKTMRSALGDQSIEAPKIPFEEFDRRAINSFQGEKPPFTIDPAWKPFIESVRSTLDEARERIQALGTGKLDHFIEDYFPHIWEDPDKAGEVFRSIASRAPLEGPASFLKERTIPTTKEGLALGLKPVSTNPIDLTLLKVREMQKYWVAHQNLNDLKETGLLKYVRAGDVVPDGHGRINDKIATVFGPRQGAVTLPKGAMTPDLAAERIQAAKQVAAHIAPSDEAEAARLDAIGDPQAANLPRPRTPSGTLKNLSKATPEELGNEYKLMVDANAQENTAQSTRETDYGDRITVGTQGSMRAEGRKAARAKTIAKLEAEMEKRGVDPAQVYVDAHQRAANADPTGFEFGTGDAPTPTPSGGDEPPTTTEAPSGTPMRAMRPEDVSVPGRRIMGEYWAPQPIAGLINNYLAPGLPQTLQEMFPGPTGKAAAMTFNAYRGLGNWLNQLQLGFSAFHLGFTSVDAATSRTALGIEYLASGKPVEGLKNILTAPAAALPGIIQGTLGDLSNKVLGTDFQFGMGAKIRQAYLNPEAGTPAMRELAQAVQEAGGRIRQDSFYKTSAIDNWLDAYHAGFSAEASKTLASKPVTNTLGALIELSAKPIMEHIVPLQKLQVFGEMAQKVLKDLPADASLTERRQALQSAWDSVDNRMGQLVYDNLFWNRTFKDLAMASTRSVGWNLGTIRELGGGLTDFAKTAATGDFSAPLSHRAAYVAALPLTVGTLGAAYQYLRTGQGPQELKDYFFPRTGDVDADGNPERVQLPSYMKDMFAYAGHPVQTIEHKVSPLPAMIAEMLHNEDFYGDQIRNPHDPLVQQFKQEADYVGKTLLPFGVRNMMESGARGDNAATRISSMFGITPAKREDVRTPAENLMRDYMKEKGSGGATPEMVAARQDRAAILSGLRGNKGVDLEAAVSKAIESGNLTPPQLARLLKRSGMTPDQERFKALPLDEAMNVFKISTDREKAKFAESLAKKIERASK